MQDLKTVRSLLISGFYIVKLTNAIGWFDFSKRTENCEEKIFEVVKAMKSRLPLPGDGNNNLNLGVNNTTNPSIIMRFRV